MKLAYIYTLKNPRTGAIRYVGKTTDAARRLRRHRTDRGDTARHLWLEELRRDGLEPELEILEVVNSQTWANRERHWIKYYLEKKCDLVNTTSGGNGAQGLSPSIETRGKISRSVMRGWEEHPRTISDEHKARLMAGRAKYRHTQAHRASVREYMLGRTVSAETRAKISQAKRGVSRGPHSEETKREIGLALRGENNGMSKLTMEKARKIRALYTTGDFSLAQLARRYQVDSRTIHRIVRNETWRE